MSDRTRCPVSAAPSAPVSPAPHPDLARAAREALACLATRTCVACDVCRLLCPDLAITREPHTGAVRIDLGACKGCGICAAFCPRGAIRMVPEPGDRRP